MNLPISFYHDLAAKAEELCRAVAPDDLRARGCYCIPYALLGRERTSLEGGDAVGGWTGVHLDLRLEDRLTCLGLWRGRGFACIIDDGQLAEQGGPAWIERKFLAFTLHELAHFLDTPPAFFDDERAAVGPMKVVAKRLRELAQQASESGASAAVGFAEMSAETRRRLHGPQFIRAGLHLSWRAKWNGWPIGERTMQLISADAGMPPIERFKLLLGNEPRDRSHEPMRDILASPLPPGFAGLCAGYGER